MSFHSLRVALACACLAACGSHDNGFTDASGSADSASADGADAAGSSDAFDSHAQPAPDAPVSEDSGPTVLTPDSACAMQTSDTTRAPMNLLILLDRSGSMADNGKWTSAVNALSRVVDGLPDDTRVGLMFLPASSNSASEAGYAAPPIAIAPLTTTRSMIHDALSATGPGGNTPMACAMVGAVNYYNTGFALDGSRNIVIITDGEPSEECSGVTCGPLDINCLINAGSQAELRVLAAAASGARHLPPVRTFVIGTPPASDTYLSDFAINGGTARAPGCDTNSSCAYSAASGTVESDLIGALGDIRGRAASCEFNIMIDTTQADPGLINVNYTSMAGAATQLIPRDTTHADGWDYSADMRSVILYGPTCDQVRANTTGGSVQILFGCPTVTPG